MTNKLKEKLARGEVVLGTFITLNCPDLVEIAGLAGFDYCIIDTEHGPGNPESIQNMLRAADGCYRQGYRALCNDDPQDSRCGSLRNTGTAGQFS